jgi:hypothetical protein
LQLREGLFFGIADRKPVWLVARRANHLRVLRTPLSSKSSATNLRQTGTTGKSPDCCPALAAKINLFPPPPNQSYKSACSGSPEGRIAIVTDIGLGMRWTRQRQARKWSQGGYPVSDRTARRRTALKRLG